MPIFENESIVDRQSFDCKKFPIIVLPEEREPSIRLRWEMDLSPGIRTVPERPLEFFTISFSIAFLFSTKSGQGAR